MPFIRIKSLPQAGSVDIPEALEAISRDFAQTCGVDIEHITATWEYFEPGHYAVAGESSQRQPRRSHPLLVTLFAPDFHEDDKIASMLKTIAAAIARHCDVEERNIFVHYLPARSGQVFDDGEIVRWD